MEENSTAEKVTGRLAQANLASKIILLIKNLISLQQKILLEDQHKRIQQAKVILLISLKKTDLNKNELNELFQKKTIKKINKKINKRFDK